MAEFQAEKILAALRRHEVDFVLVGGLAGMAHGSVVPSFDVDVTYARDRPNLERLVAALRELGATLRGAPPDVPFQVDAKTIATGARFTFETRFGSFDILSDPSGAPRYDVLKKESSLADVAGVPVLVCSLDHLIAMKEASGRRKDMYQAMEYRGLSDRLRNPTA